MPLSNIFPSLESSMSYASQTHRVSSRLTLTEWMNAPLGIDGDNDGIMFNAGRGMMKFSASCSVIMRMSEEACLFSGIFAPHFPVAESYMALTVNF